MDSYKNRKPETKPALHILMPPRNERLDFTPVLRTNITIQAAISNRLLTLNPS